MNDKELIGEAREWSGSYASWGGNGLVDRLADALEARQPSEDDLARVKKIILESLVFVNEDSDPWARLLAENILAAVPDAATEQAKEELAACLEVRAYWRSKAIEARAERDTALAAVERIREAVSGHPECDRYEEGDVISCGWKSAYASVVAALDVAPEPDNDDPCDAEVYSWDRYRPEQIDPYWIRCTLLGKHDEHEDSHTGLKWRSGLPVEGESK